MIKVIIDGNEFSAGLDRVKTMSDLVELVKVSIDPDSIITSMLLNEMELTDADWRAPLSVQGDSTLAIATGSKENYVEQRLETSVLYLEHIINEFKHSRACFGEGASNDGNVAFGTAVNDLRAFISWFQAVLELLPTVWENEKQSYNDKLVEVSGTCEQLLQQQLYQSWWALSDTMEKKLEPQLCELKSRCENFQAVE